LPALNEIQPVRALAQSYFLYFDARYDGMYLQKLAVRIVKAQRGVAGQTRQGDIHFVLSRVGRDDQSALLWRLCGGGDKEFKIYVRQWKYWQGPSMKQK